MERFAVPRFLPVEELRELSVLSWRHSGAHIIMEWLLILTAAALAWHTGHPIAVLLAIAFIGARQHGLLIIMHEAAHFRLCENRRLNDWLGEMITWPFPFVSMRQYRRHHMLHHRQLNTSHDPDWVRKLNDDWEFPASWRRILFLALQDLTGIGAIKYFSGRSRVEGMTQARGPERDEALILLARRLFEAAAAAFIIINHLWWPVLLFWFVPIFTWLQLVNRIRGIAEHFAISGRNGIFAETRSVTANLFDRIFIAPKNIGRHFEHHLYPSVPFYRLPELHRRLMRVPEFRDNIHLTKGYWGVLRECVASARTGSA